MISSTHLLQLFKLFWHYLIVILLVFILYGVSVTKASPSSQPLAKTEAKDKALLPNDNKDSIATNSGVEVGDIYVACKYYFSKLFNTRENVSRKNICNGYFFGSASMLLLLQSEKIPTNTCIPMDISTEEIIRGFLEWTDKHQDKMKMLAAEALMEMLRQNYPCMEYKAKAKP